MGVVLNNEFIPVAADYSKANSLVKTEKGAVGYGGEKIASQTAPGTQCHGILLAYTSVEEKIRCLEPAKVCSNKLAASLVTHRPCCLTAFNLSKR
jgi:hypothetical protein